MTILPKYLIFVFSWLHFTLDPYYDVGWGELEPMKQQTMILHTSNLFEKDDKNSSLL